MKKFNLILGIILTLVVITTSHFDYKWQIEENNKLQLEMQEYFEAQSDILLHAYHIDAIEEEEYDSLYLKLGRAQYNGVIFTFDAELEIERLNE